MAAERRAQDAAHGLGDAELGAMNAPIELDLDLDTENQAVQAPVSQVAGKRPPQNLRQERGLRAAMPAAVSKHRVVLAAGSKAPPAIRATVPVAGSKLPPAVRAAPTFGAAGRAGAPIVLDDEDEDTAAGARSAGLVVAPGATPASTAARKRPRPPLGAQVVDLTSPAASQGEPRAGGVSPAAPSQIQWGKRGENRWQALCPVCGPVCVAENHAAGFEPPLQDEEEGGPAGLTTEV
ncbi:hypothetical protein T492DRAFT_943648 [Pavlovales sp. CCMP2436]|nr:hypothetical protein T492DRAFT_943648 [Pavlovales sp. CCMP2436]